MRLLKNSAERPTPYPEVNAVLGLLLTNVQTVLGGRFMGMYLYGSLSSGDFDPRRSDVDFVAAIDGELPEDRVADLEVMHARIYASGLKWAKKLEGAYVPLALLRRDDPAAPPCATINEGKFSLCRLGSDWIIQRYILREQGVVVAGPGPKNLIDPVQPQDLRRAVLGILREWWQPVLSNPVYFHQGDGEDIARQAFAVLTMCRALYTIKIGGIVSKLAAASWARQSLGEPWTALINWAVNWSPTDPTDHLGQTLQFIRFTLDAAE